MIRLVALWLLGGCELFANIPDGTFVPSPDGPEGSCVTGEVTCAAPTPVCRTETETCVECLGDGDCGGLPCDLATNTCAPGCLTDDQCPSGACLADRTCADEVRVLYAAPAGAGDCSRAAPCALETAVSLLAVGRDVIQLAEGTHLTANPVTIAVNAILNGTNAVIQVPAGQFGFTHSAVAVQYHRLAIEAPGGGIPVQCQSAGTLSLVDVELRNSGAALFSSTCTLEIDRSKLSNNVSFAFSVSGGVLTIKNSFITNNGNTGVVIGTMLMDAIGADSVVEHSTIAGNKNDGTQPSAMSCSNGIGPTFKNSIIRNNTIPATCTVGNSVIDPGYTGAGVDNLVVDPLFLDPLTDNYHLMPGSPVANLTVLPTTLTVDADRQSRPQPAGSQPDFGADEIP